MIFSNCKDSKVTQLRHDVKYIYWHEEAERRQIDWDTWNALIEMLEKEGH